MKLAYLNDGRAMLSLCKDGTQNNRQLGCWLLDAFKGVKSSEFLTCSHLDGDCTNIALDNLVYETASMNYSRRKEHGTERDQRGEKNNMAKLTDILVSEIKQHITNGKHSLSTIALAYHVSSSLISMINKDKRWSHVPWPEQHNKYIKYYNTLSNNSIKEIRMSLAKGNVSQRELARRYGVSRTVISNIAKKLTQEAKQ